MKFPKQLFSAALLALLPLFAASCQSSQSGTNGPRPVNPDTVKEWWKRPGLFGNYAAIGTAKMVANEAAARTRAEVDGRNKLAASIQSTIQSIQENWSQEAGDLMDEATLSSMLNDETFIRQMVDTAMVGSVVSRYEVADGYMYVLMTLEDPDAFHAHLISTVTVPSSSITLPSGSAAAEEAEEPAEPPATWHRVRKTTDTEIDRD